MEKDTRPERDACAALVALAEREARPGVSPRRFLRRLGTLGAGVRPGLPGILDLARAGSDTLPGHGFRPELEDGSGAQVRHFCGIAACCALFGRAPTRWVSVHLRRDAPESPDGRLTDLAVELARLLAAGELEVSAAPDWIGRTLCASPPGPGRGTGSAPA